MNLLGKYAFIPTVVAVAQGCAINEPKDGRRPQRVIILG